MDRRNIDIRKKLEDSERSRQILELQIIILTYYVANFALKEETVHQRSELKELNVKLKEVMSKINTLVEGDISSSSGSGITKDMLQEAKKVSNLEIDSIEKHVDKILMKKFVQDLNIQNASFTDSTYVLIDTDKVYRLLQIMSSTSNMDPVCKITKEEYGYVLEFYYKITVEPVVASVLKDPFSSVNIGTYTRLNEKGIALFIAKALCETLEGDLFVDVDSITLYIPIQLSNESYSVPSKVPVQSPAPVPVPQPTPSPAPTASPTPATSLPLKHFPSFVNILFAEDNQINQQIFTKLWATQKETTANVVIANHGIEAIEFFKKQRFSIVFLDIEMPLKDGMETAKDMRAFEQNSGRQRTPIIALSGFGDYAANIQQSGIDGFYLKPYRWSTLRDIVLQYCGI